MRLGYGLVGIDVDAYEAKTGGRTLKEAEFRWGPLPPTWRSSARLLARAHGDDTAYRDYRDRYRDMARTLGFEGHIAWAEAIMPRLQYLGRVAS